MENKRVPEIRFSGFSGEWEERTLEDVSERVRGNDGRMELPTLTISAGSGWLDQRERFSGNIAGKEQKNYTLLSKGELSYNHGNSKLAKYGAVFELRTYEEALVPKVYHSFKTTKEASPGFIENMFATKIPDRELAKLVSSGARMDGLLNINYDEFMSIKISIPKVKEQTEIAKLVRELDGTITHHQQELTTLKKTKQGFLQKMLPQKGESVPELRFPGFTGEWEQGKLGDLTERLEYGLNASAIDYDGINKYIRITDIDDDTRLFNKNELKSPEINFSTAVNYLLEKGDILFARTGASVGKTYRYQESDEKVYYAGFLIRARIKPEFDSEFVFQNTLTPQYDSFIRVTSQRSGQPGVNAKEYASFQLMLPSKEEQTKIGNFFKQLDDTIALHEQELETLKQTKKAFLQKMFV